MSQNVLINRRCPVCDCPMEQRTVRLQQVDVCPCCGGQFFDPGELESILQIVRWYEEVRLEEPDIDTIPEAEVRRVERCPVDGAAMEPQDIAGTIVDRCPECGGFWLDAREVVALKIAESTIRQNLGLFIRLGR
jgi:Zn-finger nucleic acid-binding protein